MNRECTFNCYCKSINGVFQKWKAHEPKQNYIKTFSTENWKKLLVTSKRHHSMSNCKECAIAYQSMQEGFPGSVFNPSLDLSENVQAGRQAVTQNAAMDTWRKTQKRKFLCECRDNITEQLHRSDALTVLSEGQSLVSQKYVHVAVFQNTRSKCASSSSQHKFR